MRHLRLACSSFSDNIISSCYYIRHSHKTKQSLAPPREESAFRAAFVKMDPMKVRGVVGHMNRCRSTTAQTVKCSSTKESSFRGASREANVALDSLEHRSHSAHVG